ncbi:unnamed protein product [Anisakis simplex]|uniref:Peptidylprolyl isomerase n=1 Tax=Anisakis simplex TaxID=6269 RepID=A0A0M3JQC8_ANISI|nr:unnamed protein product [Anisakis simplex]
MAAELWQFQIDGPYAADGGVVTFHVHTVGGVLKRGEDTVEGRGVRPEIKVGRGDRSDSSMEWGDLIVDLV